MASDRKPSSSPAISRRTTLQVAASGLAVAATASAGAQARAKKRPKPKSPALPVASDSVAIGVKPDLATLAAHRLGFGPNAGLIDRIRAMGYEAYVHEQLHPIDSDDPELLPRLNNYTMPISYGPEKRGKVTIPGLKEDRPLTYLTATPEQIYTKLLSDQNGVAYQEQERPLAEVMAAKSLRAVYSKWQLREAMVDFWHNHFSVNAHVDDPMCKVMFPIYDRDVIRKNALGNFRKFLGGVARSQPMLVYLNNYTSQASPANENYARELFELHTLGAEHYYNDLYQEWSKVPGAAAGAPEGYIDQDVYEAARAFTGWTIANGRYGRGEKLPSNGDFYYYDAWHDPYQKRILAKDIDPYKPPMSDGETVLDLLSDHPGTAHFVCKKICARLVGPNPPETLVKKAVHVWLLNKSDDLQIAKTLSAILHSDEFKDSWGRAIKLPFEATIAAIRFSGAEFKPDGGYFGVLSRMGETLFGWPTPEGRPLVAEHWTGTMGMLTRWASVGNLAAGVIGFARTPMAPGRDRIAVEDVDSICRYYEAEMLGRHLSDETHQKVVDFATKGVRPGTSLRDKPNDQLLRQTIALIAMTPDYHIR